MQMTSTAAAIEASNARTAHWHSPDKYKTLFDSIDEGFCVIHVLFDAKGGAHDYVFTETNPAFERQTGLHTAVGRSMKSLAPEHEEHWFRIYGDVARTGRAVRFEEEARALARWYDVYAFRVGDAGQDLVAILFNDISGRKALESAIHRQNEQLREADIRKDRFLATLSHELRNPLAPLGVAADLLGRTDLGADKVALTREVIRRQVGHMARLLDDLLDVSRVTQGKLTLRRERVRCTGIIDTAIEAVRPLIERKQQSLEVRPDCSDPWLDADPVRMAQVVSNLLANAAKYTDPGGRICLSWCTDGPDFVLDVQDNGIGLGPSAIANLFQMFAQEHGESERSEGGLGLGLYLVRHLVELHGGSVQGRSEGPGRGSRFTVRLPLPAQPIAARTAPAAVAAGEARLKILVADDNRDAADTLATLLELSGHEVRVAYDGQSAVSVARVFQPQVAVLDIGMPKMDGYAVARLLREESWAASLRLVAATGWGDAQAREQAAGAGFDEHLTKPVGPEELQRVLAAGSPRAA
jgi:signal transduction histidine kinase/ActR/RegA family two-component response regulator